MKYYCGIAYSTEKHTIYPELTTKIDRLGHENTRCRERWKRWGAQGWTKRQGSTPRAKQRSKLHAAGTVNRELLYRVQEQHRKVLKSVTNIIKKTTITDHLGHGKIAPDQRSREERREAGVASAAEAVAEGLSHRIVR